MHVFGGSEGESIVLKLPDGGWGVVDCFAHSLRDSDSNWALHFLRSQGVEELEFLCLTHPHRDHFRGMSQLLSGLRVKQFWRPAVMSSQRLSWIITSHQQEAVTAGNNQMKADASELDLIFRLLKQQQSSGSLRICPKNATIGTQLYPAPQTSNAGCEIWALAPTGTSSDRYEEALRSCFDGSGRLRVDSAHQHHNKISMALLVVFGKTRIVLGGDVEATSWNEILREWERPQLASAAVKVSHHGSVTGYCDSLWQTFAANKKPIAVLTPYVRHKLPHESALKHIGEFVSSIETAGVSNAISAQRRSSAPIKSRLALRQGMNATAVVAQVGQCKLTFDSYGNAPTVERIGCAAQVKSSLFVE